MMTTQLTKKTTKEHYEKYRNLVKKMGVCLNPDDLSMFGLSGVDDLRERFKVDEHLNNVPLQVFDFLYYVMLRNARKNGYKGYSLAENTSMYKHALIYQVLGAIPEFTDC